MFVLTLFVFLGDAVQLPLARPRQHPDEADQVVRLLLQWMIMSELSCTPLTRNLTPTYDPNSLTHYGLKVDFINHNACTLEHGFHSVYPEEELDALDVEVEVVFEEGDANVAEVPAALLVDHVDYILKHVVCALLQNVTYSVTKYLVHLGHSAQCPCHSAFCPAAMASRGNS